MNSKGKMYLVSLSVAGLLAGSALVAQANGRQPATSNSSDATASNTTNPNGVSGRTDTNTGTYGTNVNSNKDINPAAAEPANRTGSMGRPNSGTSGSVANPGAYGNTGSMGTGSGGTSSRGTGAGSATGAGSGSMGTGSGAGSGSSGGGVGAGGAGGGR